MLKKGTLGLLLAAIALTGAVLLFENRSGADSARTATNSEEGEATEKLLPIEEEEVESFSVVRRLETESETLSFEKEEAGVNWLMTEPREATAESGAIAFLLNQITLPNARSVTVESSESEPDLEEFGLEDADYTVFLSVNEKTYVLEIGGLDFDGDSRYVQVIEIEKEGEDAQIETPLGVYVVPGGILNAVQRPTEEWLIAEDTEETNDSKEADATEEADTTEETETTDDPSQPQSSLEATEADTKAEDESP